MAREGSKWIAVSRLRNLRIFVPRSKGRGEFVGDSPLVLGVDTVIVDPGIDGRIAEGLGIRLPILSPRRVPGIISRKSGEV
jgi:hypothetical protein